MKRRTMPLNRLSNARRAKLVASVEGLCRKYASQAHKLWSHAGTIEDFDQAARLGAWLAAQRFQPKLGWRFTTYSTWWIWQQCRVLGVLKGRVVHTPTCKLPSTGRRPATVLCFQFTLERETGREMVDELFPVEAEQHNQLDAAELLKFIPDARSRFVLMRRFGLDGEAPDDLRRLAARLGISRERVRQIEKRALGWIRRRMDAPRGPSGGNGVG